MSITLIKSQTIEVHGRVTHVRRVITRENTAKPTENPNVPDVSNQPTPGNHAQRSSLCNNCLKKGQWAKACRNQVDQQLRHQQINEAIFRQDTDKQSSSDEDVYFLGEVVRLDTVSNADNKPWTADITVDR